VTARLSQAQVRSRGDRRKVGAMILLLHALPVAVLISGTNSTDWRFFACLYPFQAIGVGISLHRYFAHRSFRTSRAFQFFLALTSAATFGNAVGFAGKHRLHHQHVDSEHDVHTPLHGIWACWIGSLLDNGYTEEEILSKVPDLTRYPELMWLHRNPMVPGLTLCALAFAIGGISTVAIGVCLGAAILIHQSSAVNYLAHKYGTRRFDTPDHSRNNWFTGIATFGEGWHNNHHYCPRSARAGFAWWEIDMFFWVIWLFEKLGLVWSVRRPPAEIKSSENLAIP
jgi:stearoyl-CoA desaturase (delta-9 desaturase)